MNNYRRQFGYTLMEVVVTLFVVMILMVGVYSLVILYLQVSNDNAMHVIAIELANQKMEQIRNMPYDDVGVVSGIPSGIIPQEEIVQREGSFKINTYVQYYDDPADGQVGSTTPDTIPTDYKIATVKVSWEGKNVAKNVTVFSKIIPRTVETNQGYGLLKITVRDSFAQPVPTAFVRVVNNAVTPAINVTNLTNSQGLLYLPATSSIEAYEITVGKTNEEPSVYWGNDKTYDTLTGKIPRHLSVSQGNMTEEEFQIDPLATLRIRTVTAALPDNFQVNSAKSGKSESHPRVTSDGSDNILYAWQAEDSTSSIVYLGKYDSSGSRIWASDKTIYSSTNQKNPDISATASGGSYVVWQDSSVALKAITLAPGATRFVQSEKKIKNITRSLPKITGSGNNLALGRSILAYLDRWLSRITDAGLAVKRKMFVAFDAVNSWRRAFIKHTAENIALKEAKAVGTIVQSIKVSGVINSNNTVTLSFNNPPTPGNMMVVVAIHENSNQSFTTVTNSAGAFTASAVSNVSFGLDVGIWHKIAAAGEPSAVTVNANGNFEGGVMMLMEVSGIDTANPLNVVSVNDQTGGTSRTGTTGSTAVSTSNGFAISAIAFADNDFNDPTSANWTSATADAWTQRQWTEINGDDDTSIGVATMNVTTAAGQRGTLAVTGGGNAEERNSVIAVYNLYDPDDVRVDPGGTQSASLLKNSSNLFTGGYFAIKDLTGSHNVTSVKISENGTIDALSDLDNIKLYYDLDTSAPYDCAGESYGGTEAQFGATDTDGFSGADGTVTMNGSVAIDTARTMCVYVVLDIGAGASKDETIELEISSPNTDLTINTGTVIPVSAVVLAGATEVDVPAVLHESGYRWRMDSGDEDGASWLAGENSMVILNNSDKARLRFHVTNQGSLAISPAYRIEYGKKTTACSAIASGSWVPLPSNGTGDWRTTSSPYYADGEPTTRQICAGAFSAGEIKEDSNQSSGLALGGDTSTEIEFALAPTANVDDGVYCFRLTNAGSALDSYDMYAEATVIGDENIYLIKLDSSGSPVWAAKRVNSDDSAGNQTMPRIAVTENFGSATSVIVWQDDRNGQSDIYAQAFDEDGNPLWNGGNDMVISASTTEEIEPVVTIDSNDNVIFSWTENSGLKKIYMAKYDLGGVLSWPSPIPGPDAITESSEPSLATDNSGKFYLGYIESIGGNLVSYIAKYDSAGVLVWDKNTSIDPDSGDRNESSLVIKGSDLYSVWTDSRDGNEDIYGQKFDLDGNAVWTQDLLVSISAVITTSTGPAVAISSSGKPFAAWTDSRNPEISVFSAEMITPGVPMPASNVSLHIWGANTVSETPKIYEYDLFRTTNASGQADILVESDSGGYSVESTSTYSIMLFDPPMPLPLLPSQDQIWNIYVK